MDQAESKDQGINRQLGKRGTEPHLYSAHGLSAALLSQVLVQPWHYLAKLNAIITRDYAAALATTGKKWFWGPLCQGKTSQSFCS